MLGTFNSPVLWIGFTAVVLTLLILDLLVFHRGAHVIKPREAATWVAIWVSLALIFAVGMFIFAGPERGTEFITGYLIEWTLSVDNLFVFLIIFTYFAVPNEYRYNVLFWGILAAIILRGTFILVGAALLSYVPLDDLRLWRLSHLYRHSHLDQGRRRHRSRAQLRRPHLPQDSPEHRQLPRRQLHREGRRAAGWQHRCCSCCSS